MGLSENRAPPYIPPNTIKDLMIGASTKGPLILESHNLSRNMGP